MMFDDLTEVLRAKALRSLGSVFVAIGLLTTASITLGDGEFVYDGQPVRYWASDSPLGYLKYSIEKGRYLNTYVMNCEKREWKWVENWDFRTKRPTINAEGARWKPLSRTSEISNIVHKRGCMPGSSHDVGSAPRQSTEMRVRRGGFSWRSEGFQALTKTTTRGIDVGVSIPPEAECKVAQLTVIGDRSVNATREMNKITMSVDGRRYQLGQPEITKRPNAPSWAHVKLTRDVLKNLKSGHKLRLITDEGNFSASLDGSREAIDTARANCMRELDHGRHAGESTQRYGHDSRLRLGFEAGRAVVYFEGDIKRGDANRIAKKIRDSGASTLILNSEGGSVEDAMRLGYSLRVEAVNTRVDKQCVSACVYVLAAGVERKVARRAQVGVHRPSAGGGGTFEAGQQDADKTRRYFRTMDVDTRIVEVAAQSSSNTIRWLTPREMKKWRLVTDP